MIAVSANVGALGNVTAHADGASGVTAAFDYGDSTAADVQPTSAGAADSSHIYAANGTFTIGVTSGASTPGTTSVTVSDLVASDAFDPGAHTIAEVQDYVDDHPDESAAIRDAEAAGKARSTLLGWLDAGG